jgi:hypothetical protein
MSTWADVERIGLTLPSTTLGEAHEGSPAVLVGAQQFARLRFDDHGADVLQVWLADPGLVAHVVAEDREHRWAAPGFSRYVVMARLSALDDDTLRELLVESWSRRATARLRKEHADLR